MPFKLIKELIDTTKEVTEDVKHPQANSPHDLATMVLVSAASAAVKEMAFRKADHEKTMDEVDGPFDDSLDNLISITEEMVNAVIENLNDKLPSDYLAAVKPLFKKA
jgi:uncharacterized NAD(P)/FAD-binding protein YdhS